MRITINITSGANIEGEILSLEISPDTTVSTLKASIQAETQIASTSQNLYHNGRLLSDESRTMAQLQINDGEMLAIHVRSATSDHQVDQRRQYLSHQQNATRGHGISDPETIRLYLLGNPAARAQVINQRPEFADVLESPERFISLFRRISEQERSETVRREQEATRLNADPFDIEAQAKIQELIRQECVQENLQNALEHNPEVFGHVHMLYIDVEVNGFKVKAFIDSGAQATIMSPSCAESCGIMRLVDRRFAGMARGVGTAVIIGKVHSAQIKIGSVYLPCSFTVMEGKDVDLLLGLDMLKRHQACIDLAKGKLVIQGTEVPFLNEVDIPKNAESQHIPEPNVSGSGRKNTGAIISGNTLGPTLSTSASVLERAPDISSGTSEARRYNFAPEAVQQLEALGFSRIEAIQALEACGGNVEYAAGLLFQS